VQPTGLAAGTRIDAVYAPTVLDLIVTPAYYGNLSLAGLSETANQAAVGNTLDAFRPAAGVSMNATQSAIYTPLYMLPGSAVTPTIEQLSPTIYGDSMMVGRNNWYLVTGAISEQLEARRGIAPGDKAQTTSGPSGSTIWLTGLGQFGDVNSNGTAGYSSTSGGVATGIDMPVNPTLTVGAAFGFTSQNISAENAASFRGDAFQFELYGSLRQGITFLEMQAGGLFSEGTASRPLYAYNLQATGNTNGSAAGGSLRAGVRLDMAEWQIEPSLSVDGVSLHQGSLTEMQAGPVGLSVGSATVGSLQTLLGARAERRIPVTATVTLIPSAYIGWLHEYLDTQGATSASFIGAPGIPFEVQSAPIGRDAAVVGLRAALDMHGPVSLYAGYAGTLNGSSTAQTVSAGIRFVW
jgi:outer membrane autotransporter protein